MRQTWNHVTFLHWRYEPAVVRRLLPAELSLDVMDGSAWVGLVPFLITGLTAPLLPAIPWLSRFPETNVRTYVIDRRGRRGVWFFSLDAARLAAVIGARAGYGLPYFWGRMSVSRTGNIVEYRGARRLQPGRSDLAIDVGDPVGPPSELELFLTARFRLFARWMGRPVFARVEHPQWPLRKARLIRLEESLVRASGLPDPKGEPLVHFADRVDVRTGRPELAR